MLQDVGCTLGKCTWFIPSNESALKGVSACPCPWCCHMLSMYIKYVLGGFAPGVRQAACWVRSNS